MHTNNLYAIWRFRYGIHVSGPTYNRLCKSCGTIDYECAEAAAPDRAEAPQSTCPPDMAPPVQRFDATWLLVRQKFECPRMRTRELAFISILTQRS